MQRPFCALALIAVALSPGLARPGDEPGAAAPEITTAVQGSVPDLAGRWLVVAELSPPGQSGTIPLVYGWEVTRPEGGLRLAFRWGGLPPAMQASLDAAAAKREPWAPTPQQLDELRDGWDTIAPEHRPVASIDTRIIGPEAEPEGIKADSRMTGSLFTVLSAVSFEPGPQRPMKDGIVLGATERLADGYRGNYLSTTLIAAPFPIPMTLNGTFRMYRLGPEPRRGWLQRLADLFAGCGRTSRT